MVQSFEGLMGKVVQGQDVQMRSEHKKLLLCEGVPKEGLRMELVEIFSDRLTVEFVEPESLDGKIARVVHASVDIFPGSLEGAFVDEGDLLLLSKT